MGSNGAIVVISSSEDEGGDNRKRKGREGHKFGALTETLFSDDSSLSPPRPFPTPPSPVSSSSNKKRKANGTTVGDEPTLPTSLVSRHVTRDGEVAESPGKHHVVDVCSISSGDPSTAKPSRHVTKRSRQPEQGLETNENEDPCHRTLFSDSSSDDDMSLMPPQFRVARSTSGSVVTAQSAPVPLPSTSRRKTPAGSSSLATERAATTAAAATPGLVGGGSWEPSALEEPQSNTTAHSDVETDPGRQKQLQKEKQKQERAEATRRNKALRGEFAVNQVKLRAHHDLLSKKANKISKSMEDAFIATEEYCPTHTSLMNWVMDVEGTRTILPKFVYLVGAEDFRDGPLKERISEVMKEVVTIGGEESFLVAVIEGFDRLIDKVQKERVKAIQNGKQMPHVTLKKDELMFSNVDLLLNWKGKVQVKRTSGVKDTTRYLVDFSKSAARCFFAPPLSYLSCAVVNKALVVGSTAEEKSKERKSQTFINMLLQIPSITEDYASAVTSVFPTVQSLLKQYYDPNKPISQKKLLLATLDVCGRNFGPARSQKIFETFTVDNPDHPLS